MGRLLGAGKTIGQWLTRAFPITTPEVIAGHILVPHPFLSLRIVRDLKGLMKKSHGKEIH